MKLKEQLQTKDNQLEEKKELISNLQIKITQIQKEINNIKFFPADF